MRSPPRQPDQRHAARPVDLLLVGGLTVDRFADGSTAPGGSVLHGSRAARASAFSVGIVTCAGDEPEARAGLREMQGLAETRVQFAARSITFGHEEHDGARTLTLLARGVPLRPPAQTFRARGILFAPVAAELGAGMGDGLDDQALLAATLQGWLRSLEPQRPVAALGLDAIERELVERLGTLDLLVASEEDLAAVASDPLVQLGELRATFGPRPVLALTRGPRGALIDAAGLPRLEIVPDHVISGTPMTGAGDAFAAVLTASLAAGTPLRNAAEVATAAAVGYLDRRRRGSASGAP
jgi:sugar/nucleoside kinase (ribokinase family)